MFPNASSEQVSWSSPTRRHVSSSPIKSARSYQSSRSSSTKIKGSTSKVKRPRGRPRVLKSDKACNSLAYAAEQDLLDCTASLNSAAALKQGIPNFRAPLMRVSPFKTPYIQKNNSASVSSSSADGSKLTPLTRKLLMVANSSAQSTASKQNHYSETKVSKHSPFTKKRHSSSSSKKTPTRATPSKSFSNIFQSANTQHLYSDLQTNTYYDKDLGLDSNLIFSSPSSHTQFETSQHVAENVIPIANESSAGQLLDNYFFTSPVMHLDLRSDPLIFPEESVEYGSKLLTSSHHNQDHTFQVEGLSIPVMTNKTPTKLKGPLFNGNSNTKIELKLLESPSTMLQNTDFAGIIREFSNTTQLQSQQKDQQKDLMGNNSFNSEGNSFYNFMQQNINSGLVVNTSDKKKMDIDTLVANGNKSSNLRPLLPPITLSNIDVSSSEDDDDDDEYDQRMNFLRYRRRNRLLENNFEDENNVFLVKPESNLLSENRDMNRATNGKLNLSVDSDGEAILTINDQCHNRSAQNKKHGAYASTSSTASSYRMRSSEADNESLLLSSPFLNEFEQEQYGEAFECSKTRFCNGREINNYGLTATPFDPEIDHDKTFTKDDDDEGDITFSAVRSKFQNFLSSDGEDDDDDETAESAAAQFDARIALMRAIHRLNII